MLVPKGVRYRGVSLYTAMLLVTVCYDVQDRHPTTTHAALILFGIYRIAGNIGCLKLWWFCPKLTEKNICEI